MPTNPRKTKADGLNLLPFMNLVTLLIPLLLMASQFVELAVIDSTVPGIIANTDPNPPPQAPPLHLVLAVGRDGISVGGADALLAPDGGEATVDCASPCVEPDDYDLAALQHMLLVVKDAHPDEDSLILQPDAGVPFDVLVAVLDASRSHEGRALFPAAVFAGG